MAVTKHLISVIGGYLKQGEEPIGAARAAARGTAWSSALLGGVGAAAGWLVAGMISDGVLAAALGGGLGAAVGMLIGGIIGTFRMQGAAGLRSSTVLLVLTRRRLLVFRTSLWANKPSGLAREIPIDAIASITTGEPGYFTPQAVAVDLVDGEKLTLESARQERVGELAEAFTEATGR
jgi:hypothetical protein